MINTTLREYDYYTYNSRDAYGQQQLSDKPQGAIKMAIYNLTTTVTDSIKYKEATYVGLTWDRDVSDDYCFDYNGTMLKVLYTIKVNGLQTQVFMSEV